MDDDGKQMRKRPVSGLKLGLKLAWARGPRPGRGRGPGRGAAFALALGLALGPGMAAAPGAARAETLADAFILAYRNSGLLDQNRALLRAADESVAQALAATRPVIRYSLSATANGVDDVPDFSNLTATAQLTAQVTVFDAGASKLAIDAAKETVLATRESLVNIEQQVLQSTVSAFMGVISAASIVNLRESNVALIRRELQAARDRFDVGDITRTDVSIAEAALAEAQSRLASARGDLATSREQYRQAVGRYPGTLVFPSSLPAMPESSAAATEVAVRTHPQIRQAMREVTVGELNIARAEAALRPSLTANGSLGVNQNGVTTNSLGLTLSGPIYQGGQLTSLIRQAQARRDAARASLHLARLQIEQTVQVAWSNVMVADASLAATREQVRAATLALRGVQEEARLGARTTLDVLDAEQELLDARAAEVTANSQRVVAIYSVLQAMGLLTVDHLNLGITTYDPAAYYNAVRDAPTRYVSPQGERLDRVLKALNR